MSSTVWLLVLLVSLGCVSAFYSLASRFGDDRTGKSDAKMTISDLINSIIQQEAYQQANIQESALEHQGPGPRDLRNGLSGLVMVVNVENPANLGANPANFDANLANLDGNPAEMPPRHQKAAKSGASSRYLAPSDDQGTIDEILKSLVSAETDNIGDLALDYQDKASGIDSEPVGEFLMVVNADTLQDKALNDDYKVLNDFFKGLDEEEAAEVGGEALEHQETAQIEKSSAEVGPSDEEQVMNEILKSILGLDADNFDDLAGNHQEKASGIDLKPSGDLGMIVNVKKSANLDDNSALEEFFKILADSKASYPSGAAPEPKKSLNSQEISKNLASSDDQQAINDILNTLDGLEAGNLEDGALNHQDQASSIDPKPFGDLGMVVKVEKSANLDDNSALDEFFKILADPTAYNPSGAAPEPKKSLNSQEISKNLASSHDQQAINEILKTLNSLEAANLEDGALNHQDQASSINSKPLIDLPTILNVPKAANIKDSALNHQDQAPEADVKPFIDLPTISNVPKAANIEMKSSPIINDLKAHQEAPNDLAKFFYDIDEPVGFEYYPVLAEGPNEVNEVNQLLDIR